MKINLLLILCFLFIAPAYALTQNSHSFTSIEESQRFTTLTKEVRCVVCQNQSIADSNAPLANDLREKIYKMVSENKSDSEIKNYLVKRYGEFILLRPRLSKLTTLLWLFPLIGLTTIFLMLSRLMRPSKNAA